MTYRKSDEPFGLLPKKSPMDLERGGELFSVQPSSEIEPMSRRSPELDVPASRPAKGQLGTRDQGRSSP